MRNWLIRLLGGLTATEFSDVFNLADLDRKVMDSQFCQLAAQANARQVRIDYLENLILTKVGYIASLDISQSEVKDFQPIGGQNTWGKVKHQLEMKDHKLMQERNKNASH